MFYKYKFKFLFCISQGLLFCANLCAQTDQPPNVILILSDDQGTFDAACYGASDLQTPGIDRIANTGLRFTQFYVGAALCSPSRAAILTGRTPHGAGLAGNASSFQGNPGLPAERETLAEMLKNVGYRTAHIGKWHLGYTTETMPNAQGFDYSFGHMGGCIDNYSHFFYWNGPNRHDLWENGRAVFADGQFFPELMAEKADVFIRSNKDRPFFMYYAINVPHYPYQPKAKWRDYYQDLESPRREYAGFVSTMDENIDRLLNTLEDEGIRENTIVIFLSDHGHSVEERAFRGGGYAGDLRGSKMSLFEGGIRVPFVISWPDQLEKGATRDQFCMSMDLLPTLANWCGVNELPSGLEGIAQNQIFEQNENSTREQGIWKMGRQWAIRNGPWKLIGNPRDPTGKLPLNSEQDLLFLANLDQDSTESQNLARQYPEKVEELKNAYLAWAYASERDIPEILPPLNNKAFGAIVNLQTTPHPRYTSEGGSALVNNKRGTYNFTDGQWLGFLGKDLKADLELSKPTRVDTITFRVMQDQQNYIFLPESFSASFSTDGQEYQELPLLSTDPALQRENGRILEYHLPLGATIKYLKVRVKNIGKNPSWHADKNADAFLFIDEIILK